jgi:hypothetical protein
MDEQRFDTLKLFIQSLYDCTPLTWLWPKTIPLSFREFENDLRWILKFNQENREKCIQNISEFIEDLNENFTNVLYVCIDREILEPVEGTFIVSLQFRLN